MASEDLAVIGQSNWSAEWEASLTNAASDLYQRSSELDALSTEVGELLELPAPVVTRAQFVAMQVLCEEIPALTTARLQLASHPDLASLRDTLNNAVTLTGHYDQLKRSLTANYKPDAELNLPLDQLNAWHEQAQSLRWPRRSWVVRKMRKKVSTQASGKPEPLQDIPVLLQMRDIRTQLRTQHQLVKHFAAHWAEVNSDFLTISERLDDAEQLAGTIGSALGSTKTNNSLADTAPSDLDSVASAQVISLTNRLKAVGQHPDQSARCTAYAALATEHQAQLKAFVELASPSQRISGSNGANWAAFVGQLAQGVIRRRWDIKDWCSWREITGGSLFTGYQQLMEQVASGAVSSQLAACIVQFACARCWLEKHLNKNDPDLPDEVSRHLSAPAQHRHIASRYRQLLINQLVDSHENAEPGCLVTTLANYQNRRDYERRRYDDIVLADADQLTVTQAIQAMAYGTRIIFFGNPARPLETDYPSRYQYLTDGVL